MPQTFFLFHFKKSAIRVAKYTGKAVSLTYNKSRLLHLLLLHHLQQGTTAGQQEEACHGQETEGDLAGEEETQLAAWLPPHRNSKRQGSSG
jgi:hypothetical protein